MSEITTAKWFKGMLDKMRTTPEFKDETIKLLEGEISTLEEKVKKAEERIRELEKAVDRHRNCEIKDRELYKIRDNLCG